MSPSGKLMIYALATTLLFSSWVSAELSCRSQGAAAVHDVPASEHAQHVQTDAERVDHDMDETMADCSCCDDCVTLCAGVGGTTLTNVAVLGEPPFDVLDRLSSRTAEFRPQPPPQSLFRPPIS